MAEAENKWYNFEGVEQVDSPALLIYPEHVIQNITRLIAMMPSVDLLRPHVKTNKSIDVSRLMLQHGIHKFKCATIAEAEMLGMCGAKDVLLAYQPVLAKLKRLVKLIDAYPETKFSCLVDNIETAEMISAYAQENETSIAVYVDLNVGMNRTGIKPGLAFDLYAQLLDMPGITLLGLHAYDGHINDVDLDERTEHCNAAFEPVEKLRERIQQYGYDYPLLIAGGSPTCMVHAQRQNVECSPGTFIFWDKGYHNNIPEQDFLFAALVLCRIVSMPDESKICIDLGHKAIASENELQKRVYFLNAPHLKPISHSEEHIVVEVDKGHSYKIGDVFYALPYHVCPTIALYNKANTVRNNVLDAQWPITARGREINI
jgi:D-serine deaminase-like pyridoxal phosphate-dependent protein